MSGGVDSSAAALLLKNEGYEVFGVTMLLTPDASEDSQDALDAAEVCKKLGIKHECVDFRKAFSETVIENFVNEYRLGRTPNPCIVCNRDIKFGLMLDHALKNGFEYIATGHYAKTALSDDGIYSIFRTETKKDQSYVLWTLSQEKLSHVIFPAGKYTKDRLRSAASEAGLDVSAKKDSQDICFIKDGDYKRFLISNYEGFQKPGYILNKDGKILGRHCGVENYTVGQRKGLGIDLPCAMYVTKIENGNVYLGVEGSQYSRFIICDSINFISGRNTSDKLRALVKHRYSSPLSPANIYLKDGKALIEFDEPQRALTPGQSAVFYQNDLLLGGGIIQKVPESADDF